MSSVAFKPTIPVFKRTLDQLPMVIGLHPNNGLLYIQEHFLCKILCALSIFETLGLKSKATQEIMASNGENQC
jgi:hypothetical protein